MADFILQTDERLDEINADLRLIQKKKGLTFGSDAYLLSAFVKAKSHDTVVDLGAGTGVIAFLLMAKNKAKKAVCVEIQSDFCDLIERNASLNGFEHVMVVNKNVREVKLSDVDKAVDLVVSNPPYMKTTSGRANGEDVKNVARHETFGDVGDFCACASRLLKSGGKFDVVYLPERLADLLSGAEKVKLSPKKMVFVHGDASSEPSVVLVEFVKEGKTGLKVLPPIFLHDADTRGQNPRPLSDTAKRIYDNCTIE